MIVTCPACSARYNVKESKIQGRGAKITCPRCGHRFVVYRNEGDGDGDGKAPENVGALDFSEVGITWRVRKGPGKHTYDFRDLASLREMQQDGQVDRWDQLSFDGREWTAIDAIPSLETYFFDVWQRARSGELTVPDYHPEDHSEEDDSDAPTTIVGRGSSLASEIRQAVADAATPSPGPQRAFDDSRSEEAAVLMDPTSDPDVKKGGRDLGPDLAGPTEAPSPIRRAAPSSSPPPVMPEPVTPAPAVPTPAPAKPQERPAPAPVPAPEPPKVAPPAPPAPPGPNFALIGVGFVVVLVIALAVAWGSGMFAGADGGSEPTPVERPAPTPPANEPPSGGG